MVNIFSETYAAYIQQVSFPLAVFGLILTFIEIIHPKKADSLEQFIDSVGEVSKLASMILLFGAKETLKRSVGVDRSILKLATVILLIVFLVITAVTIGFVVEWYRSGDLSVFTSIYFWIFGGSVVYGFAVYSLSKFVDFLNYLSEGKAIGAIGLILAFVGVVGEAYQVVTLCITKGCY